MGWEMKFDLRNLKSIHYFDNTFILKIDNGLTFFCNKEYTVGSNISSENQLESDNCEMYFDVDIPISFDNLVYLWEAALWYISKRVDCILEKSEYKFYVSMTRYIRRALTIHQIRMA